MQIAHHPDDSTLMSYAAGSLTEAASAVVAAHVSLCAHCRRELKLMERIGLACVRALPEEQLSRKAPIGRLGAREADVEPDDGNVVRIGGDVPVPLRQLLGTYLDDVRWRRLGPGVWHHPLALSGGKTGDLRLLRVQAGRAMPEHGHGGAELTLMLRGAYTDRFGRFATGDIADLDAEVVHRPVVEAGEDCICLVASEQKARFKGLISRLVQPLTGM